jgi:hypothetical protein
MTVADWWGGRNKNDTEKLRLISLGAQAGKDDLLTGKYRLRMRVDIQPHPI